MAKFVALFLALSLTLSAQVEDPRTGNRKQHRVRQPPAGFPSVPPQTAAPPLSRAAGDAVVELRGRLCEVAVDYQKEYWIKVYPNFPCELRLPLECTALVLGNQDRFEVYTLEVERVLNPDGSQVVKRDDRIVIIHPKKPETVAANAPVEAGLQVPLKNGRTLFFNIQNADTKGESTVQVTFRDPEQDRREFERLQAEAQARQETEAKAERHNRLLASLKTKALAVGEPGPASRKLLNSNFSLTAFREDTLVVAVVRAKVNRRDKAAAAKWLPPGWKLDGKTVTPVASGEQAPPNDPAPNLWWVVFEAPPGGKLIEVDLGDNQAALAVPFPKPPEATPKQPELTAAREPAPPPPMVAEPKRNDPVQPVKFVPPPLEPAPNPGLEGPKKRLQELMERYSLSLPEKHQLAEKEFGAGLYAEATGPYLLVVVALRRTLGSRPIRLGEPVWTIGGVKTIPVLTSRSVPPMLETRPVAAGFVFLRPEGAQTNVSLGFEANGRKLSLTGVVQPPPVEPAPTQPAMTAVPPVEVQAKTEPERTAPAGAEPPPVTRPEPEPKPVQAANLKINPERKPALPGPKPGPATPAAPKQSPKTKEAELLYRYQGEELVIKVLEINLRGQATVVTCEVVSLSQAPVKGFTVVVLEKRVADGMEAVVSRRPDQVTQSKAVLEHAGDYATCTFTFQNNILHKPLEFRWSSDLSETAVRLENGFFVQGGKQP